MSHSSDPIRTPVLTPVDSGLVKGVAQAPEIAEEDINIMFQTNVTGLIGMTQEILKIYKSRPDGGKGDIINVGSIAGREGYPGGSIYCATKAAVRTFTDALRRELISTRIRVIEIDPGQVETVRRHARVLLQKNADQFLQEFSVVRFYGDKSKADAVYKGCDPLTPDDIAEVIVFTAGRRENVVIADTLIFPNHQVSNSSLAPRRVGTDGSRHPQRSCTGSREGRNNMLRSSDKLYRLVPVAQCTEGQ